MRKMLDSIGLPEPAQSEQLQTPAEPLLAGAGFAARLLTHDQQGPLACIECDHEGRINHWNPAAQQLFGHTPAAALGRKLHELLCATATMGAFLDTWEQALTGQPGLSVCDNLTQDGSPRSCIWSLTRINNRGQLRPSMICIALDITAQQQAVKALGERHRHLQTAQRLARLGLIVWDLIEDKATLHEGADVILGYPKGTVLSRQDWLAHIAPQDRERIEAQLTRAKSLREPELQFSCQWQSRLGDRIELEVIAEFQYEADGRPKRSISTIQDVTLSHAALRALADSEARLDNAQKMARVGDWEWDFLRKKARVSKEALRILGQRAGWDPDAREFILSLPAAERDRVVGLFRDAIRKRDTGLRYEYRIASTEHELRDIYTIAEIEYTSDGTPARIKAVTQEITELKAYERQLHELSFYDSVTQLPNRALFIDRFKQALSDSNWHDHRLGVMMLDLDRFKQINDSLGHNIGDDLLKHTALRLQDALRDYDTVARLGGDEFGIILPEIRQATDLAVIADKVVNAFSQPFTLGGREVVVTASVGVALYPNDGEGVDALMQYADAALYHAKSKGRNNFQFYSKELTAHATERLSLESDLRKALERGELELFYQPKVDIGSGALIGAEALMRWNHPSRGMVPPDKFIGIAEDTGLILPMGAWALQAACSASAKWNHGRERALKIAVNLSPRQFESPDFVQSVLATLKATGCQADWIELEITESLLLDSRDDILSMLEALSVAGISIAIDDFGTGYSALSYLTRFPVQILKIDRSFVRGLPADLGSVALVKAVVSLAQSLHMGLVAEGVETDEQAAHLLGLGCEMAQGFLYSKPLPQAKFEERLAAPA